MRNGQIKKELAEMDGCCKRCELGKAIGRGR